jgi:hypothetical protein
VQVPEGHAFPQDPQFAGSDWRSTQTRPDGELQVMLRGQQKGLMLDRGGIRKPGLLRAT